MSFTKSVKGVLCLTLALILCLSSSSFVFAAEPAQEYGSIVYEDANVVVLLGNPDDPNAPISTTALSATRGMDYESTWLDRSASGKFPIYTSKSGTIGITLKVESRSNSSWAYISVQKPNKSYFKNNVYVDPTTRGGEGWAGKMYSASSGTYYIHYAAHTSVGMRIMCWMY